MGVILLPNPCWWSFRTCEESLPSNKIYWTQVFLPKVWAKAAREVCRVRAGGWSAWRVQLTPANSFFSHVVSDLSALYDDTWCQNENMPEWLQDCGYTWDRYLESESWSPKGPWSILGLTSHLRRSPPWAIPNSRWPASIWALLVTRGWHFSGQPGPYLNSLILRKGFCLLSWNLNLSNVHWLTQLLFFELCRLDLGLGFEISSQIGRDKAWPSTK